MAKITDLFKSNTSWWMLLFIIAQNFQIVAIHGYNSLQDIRDFAGGIAPAEKAYYTFAFLTTIAYFILPLFFFVFQSNKITKISLWAGTVFYTVQMSIFTNCHITKYAGTSSPLFLSRVAMGFGWAGWACAVFSSFYIFFRNNSQCGLDGDFELASWSNFFNAIVPVFISISQMGWIGLGNFLSFGGPFVGDAHVEKCWKIVSLVAFLFAGFASIFSFYETRYFKTFAMIFSCIFNLTAAILFSAFYEWDGSSHAAAFAFSWLAFIFSFTAFVGHQMTKKTWGSEC